MSYSYRPKPNLILVFISLSVWLNTLNAQQHVILMHSQAEALEADAGADLLVPPNSLLGGTITATGGTPAYTYLWSPSSAVNDQTAANPVFIGSSELTIMLTVTDARLCEAYDSVNVSMNSFEEEVKEPLEIYPNPVKDKLEVAVNIPLPVLVKIRLFDLAGRLVFVWEKVVDSPHFFLDMSAYQSGKYLLETDVNETKTIHPLYID